MPDSTQTHPATEPTLTAMLSPRGALRAIEFYAQAFGAVEVASARMMQEDGRVGHAEIRIGDAVLMLADEFPEISVYSPETLGGAALLLLLRVPDTDAAMERAVAAGAKLTRAASDNPYGRTGKVEDPFGYGWMLLGPVRDA
jgi:PhnB protein